jgi:hypothetical protein
LLSVLILLSMAFPSQSVAAAITLTASLDRNTISLGERATLLFRFDGGSPPNTPEVPSIPNLQVTYLGPSSQVRIVNGNVSSIMTHTYILTPQQIGEYTIPAITVDAGSEKLTSQPLTLKVAKAASSVSGNSGQQMAMLKLVLPKKEVFVGEVFTAELQIYLHSSVVNFGGFQIASFPTDGFTAGKISENPQRRVQVDNATYTLLPLTVVLTSIKAGTFTLGPVSARMIIELANPARRNTDFDPFGMFNRNEQREIVLATEAEPIQSLNLPAAGVPRGFNGAVGQYTMTVNAGPTNIAVGDPITVRVEISGRGAMDGLNLPEQPAWHDFKTYPPTAKVESADPLGIQGRKTFEQIVVPQSTDIKSLPSFSFSFFDPVSKIYRTLSHPPVTLLVRPGGSTPNPTIVANRTADNSPPLSQDIVPIKQRLGTVAQISPVLPLQPWFLALQLVPVAGFILAVVWRKRNESLANNPKLRRQRQVALVIRDGLIDLRRLAAENNSDGFFATLFRLLQEQLGERLDLPASAITEAVIDDQLRRRGVPDALLDELRDLFQSCNLARYAPVRSSQELAAFVPRLETALRQLREFKW